MSIQPYNGTDYEICDKYSFKSFINGWLVDEDLEGKTIYGSDFCQSIPESQFVGNQHITFIKCRLDNCAIPPNITLIDCSTKRFEEQVDGQDWEIDDEDDPTRPLNWKYYVKKGLPIPEYPEPIEGE